MDGNEWVNASPKNGQGNGGRPLREVIRPRRPAREEPQVSPSPVPADSAAGVSTPSLAPPGPGPGPAVPRQPGPGTAIPQQPGPGPAAGSEPGYGPRRRIDGFAVAALIFGILPLAPFALAAGLAGLARTAGGRRPGRPAAVGGLVLAGGWAVAGAVAGVLVFLPGPAPRLQLPRDTVFTLRAGQCADTAGNGVSRAHAVPCSQPHAAEIYASYRLAGQGWPGQAAVSQRARQGCQARLAGYLDPALLGASLTASYAYPDQVSWAAGARTIVCEIRGAGGLLTGSVRGLGKTPG